MDHFEDAAKYATLLTKLIASVPIQNVMVRLYPDGLQSVREGFQYMQEGMVRAPLCQLLCCYKPLQVHAEKLTYRLEDTPEL